MPYQIPITGYTDDECRATTLKHAQGAVYEAVYNACQLLEGLEGVGRQRGNGHQRDAVHVAVAPVVAAELLNPGQRVRLCARSTERVCDGGDCPIGVIDPFLDYLIRPEQRCWLLLPPGTVTQLRHDWQHPAFDSEPLPSVEESERWIREYLDRIGCGQDYEAIVHTAVGDERKTECGGEYIFDDYYLYTPVKYIHEEIPPELWRHIENVTGKVCVTKPTRFDCGC